MDLDPALEQNPAPDLTPFFSDLKDAKKNYFFIAFSYNYPKNIIFSLFLLNFVLEFYFVAKHYFSPLNTFVRKGKDPDPDQ